MKGLREKFRNKKGFTLVEMLIVVAIIAILIAVSIPLVGSALEKARNATDAANERAFKAALVSSYLLNNAGMKEAGATEVKAGEAYAYKAAEGKVVEANITVDGYGQSETTKALKGCVLYGTVNAEGDVTVRWSSSALTSANDITSAADNCITSTMIKTTS